MNYNNKSLLIVLIVAILAASLLAFVVTDMNNNYYKSIEEDAIVCDKMFTPSRQEAIMGKVGKVYTTIGYRTIPARYTVKITNGTMYHSYSVSKSTYDETSVGEDKKAYIVQKRNRKTNELVSERLSMHPKNTSRHKED